ncbi:hypothetical protein [Natrialba sp. SSL1]|uniref:hypothetical protein n=1 Tax=Natrialba sp. SSL1 TaxID=1869245 RepID=UPI00111440E5|nr:hypothetical protein [Natrialba sp. SSL1]
MIESGLEWQPSLLASSYRTHVLASDHSPSLRSLLFTAADGPALESGLSFELGLQSGVEDEVGEAGQAEQEGNGSGPSRPSSAALPAPFVSIELQGW